VSGIENKMTYYKLSNVSAEVSESNTGV